MDPTRSTLDEPESADTDTTYTQLVARYSRPQTVAAALERVTAQARQRKAAERVYASRAATLSDLYAASGSAGRHPNLAVEALVRSVADRSQVQGQLPEHVRIWELCRKIKSVAEVSALLRVSLGVARMLIADMTAEGLGSVAKVDLVR
ncbi:DUF742 domain-containing protein [Streptomyces sp. NPDC002701]|uniref:DUF742 domain-containing protein n=1 Tax=Streptomyces sp. NPDC002701 TaxID=3364661 RepID=UPI0036850DF7